MTTIGYGDIIAHSMTGRILVTSSILVLAGIFTDSLTKILDVV